MISLKPTMKIAIRLAFTVIILTSLSCGSARSKMQKDSRNQPLHSITNKGISMKIPHNWIVQYASLVDTVSQTKMGEILPGIVTPKTGSFTGQDFLYQLTAKEEIEFEETHFSFDGMPYELVKTDSVKLQNTTWYWGVLLYEINTPYQYAYFGDFGKCGVMINFYTETHDISHEKRFNRILETVEISP